MRQAMILQSHWIPLLLPECCYIFSMPMVTEGGGGGGENSSREGGVFPKLKVSSEFLGRNVVFNKTIAGRRRTLLLKYHPTHELQLTSARVGQTCTIQFGKVITQVIQVPLGRRLLGGTTSDLVDECCHSFFWLPVLLIDRIDARRTVHTCTIDEERLHPFKTKLCL